MLLDDDRRAFKRLPMESTVLFRAMDESQPMYGAGRNLSGNGISFITDRSVPVGSELDVRVMPTLQRLSPLNARVKVVRVQRDAHHYVVSGLIEKIM